MSVLTKGEGNKLQSLRQRLHREPELSGQEYGTPLILQEFLRPTAPDEVLTSLGGTGLAVIYNGKAPGPTVMLRADMDALPICETNTFAYKSIHEEVSHKCGHDGHMAMLAGVGLKMKDQRPEMGRVILLFQPAEETGQGAKQVIEDSRYQLLSPDYVFGIHNLPRHDLHTVYLSPSHFASASCGITITFKGETAHAGTPHTGKSPALAVSRLIAGLHELPSKQPQELKPLVTVVHALVGEKAFGVAPGFGEVSATVRSITTEGMQALAEAAEALGRQLAEAYGLRVEISLSEVFPATTNDENATEHLQEAVGKAGLRWERLERPFAWSEDFGHYLRDTTGSFFGLGAGEDSPDLHAENYDFPDALIPTGVQVYMAVIDEILNIKDGSVSS